MSYLISTKGRYALRVMIELAQRGEGSIIPLKDIANFQDISTKYLESIMPSLTGAGLVTGVSGKGGGYSLAKPVAEYTVGEILRVSEELLAPVVCLGEDFVCDKADGCKALPVWMKLDSIISDYPHLC